MAISSLFSLEGQVALVTGASRGIGKGIAVGLASAGANLALIARSESTLIEAQKEIRAIGVQAEIFPCDLNQTENIPGLAAAVNASYGQIDIWSTTLAQRTAMMPSIFLRNGGMM